MRLFFLLLLVFGWLSPSFGAQQNLFVFDPRRPIIAKVTPLGQSSLVALLDSETMEPISQFEVAGVSAQNVEFGPNEQLLIGSKDRLVAYDISLPRSPKKVFEAQPSAGEPIHEPHFAPDSNQVYWAEGNKLYVGGPPLKEPQEVSEAKHKITDLTPMKDRQVAFSEAGSPNVWMASTGADEPAKAFESHQSEVAGVESPDGRSLYSLSKDQKLIKWDILHQQPIKTFELSGPPNPKGLQSDDLKQKLYVIRNADGSEEVFGYRLFDLDRGQTNAKPESLVQTDSGAFYSGFESLGPKGNKTSSSFGQSKSSNFSRAPRDPNSPYQLAKIESDNGNYDSSLNYIRQVESKDPEFRQSRELRKEVFQKIENRQNLNVAKEQYQTGNYKAAEILLEGVLAKDPKYAPAKRYLKLTQSKRFNQKLGNFLWFLFFLLLLAGIGYLIWRWKQTHQKIDPSFLFKKMDGDQKRKLTHLIRKTEQLLALRRKQDKMGYYHKKLADIEEELNQVKRDLGADKATFSQLFEQVSRLHQELLSFAKGRSKATGSQAKDSKGSAKQKASTQRQEKPQGEKKEKGPTEEPKDEQEKQKAERPGQESGKQKEQGPGDKKQQGSQPPPQDKQKTETPNWYDLLGVSPHASTQEIKESYRKKIKEYHPDKHNSSDFEWVKEEAERMTRLVGEAYECLLNPKSRKQYDQDHP